MSEFILLAGMVTAESTWHDRSFYSVGEFQYGNRICGAIWHCPNLRESGVKGWYGRQYDHSLMPFRHAARTEQQSVVMLSSRLKEMTEAADEIG